MKKIIAGITVICLASTMLFAINSIAAEENFTKSEYSKLFCEILNISPVADDADAAKILFVDLLDKKDKNWKYMAAMFYALPGASWDGKDWHANPNENVTNEMVFKSFCIHRSYKLIDAVAASALIEDNIPDFDTMGYSEDSVVYIATLINEGLKPSEVPLNSILDKKSAKEQLILLDCLPKNGDIITKEEGFTITNTDMPARQEYYMDGPIINENRIVNYVGDDYILHQFAGLKAETNIDTENVSYGIGLWSHAQTSVGGGQNCRSIYNCKGDRRWSERPVSWTRN